MAFIDGIFGISVLLVILNACKLILYKLFLSAVSRYYCIEQNMAHGINVIVYLLLSQFTDKMLQLLSIISALFQINAFDEQTLLKIEIYQEIYISQCWRYFKPVLFPSASILRPFKSIQPILILYGRLKGQY